MNDSLHQSAALALAIADPAGKCAATHQMRADRAAGRLRVASGPDDLQPLWVPGRPQRPELVAPEQLRPRKPATPEGHAALIHAIAHIEFNAINLALDCIARYRSFPDDFHDGWLQVAAEEAQHFSMLRARLRELGYDYGDFPAHNGLWDMACRTAHDPLARMALVPRVLEARGLDATPVIMGKLRAIGDEATLAILDVILRDEVGHVALGDRWFRLLCAERGLEPEATYLALMNDFGAPWPQPPLHEAARLQAGFSPAEIERLRAGRRE
ncbi:MAG: ferritin-like domain-containing protein [Pseudazoarcus pumilus]|nr:ferritin-like domain-containing protein [Pseudazoarcus pumilus]